jgi:tetraacyldisaccharide 4'-kinase
MQALRIILFPFTFLYGFVIILRNCLYDAGIFKSFKFDVPIISVGNLTAGGAGKSPMTEYLVNLLQKEYKIAILSRGYGRKTRGFYEAKSDSPVEYVGDEPLQFKNKFPDASVAVCEKRVTGIRNLQDTSDLILLDDAYQHREVSPGFSILLFDYTSLIKWQWLLPTGDLREPMSGKKRADCIVITKTPLNLDSEGKRMIIDKIKPDKNQSVFFSYIHYGELVSIEGEFRSLDSISITTSVLLLTGIANPAPLVKEIRKYTNDISHHSYPDHHVFTPKNMIKLAADFNNLNNSDKIIITTEKDLQRLKSAEIKGFLHGLPVCFLRVKAAFHEPERTAFDALIQNYVTKHRRND